jgi:hypothetical protein
VGSYCYQPTAREQRKRKKKESGKLTMVKSAFVGFFNFDNLTTPAIFLVLRCVTFSDATHGRGAVVRQN